MAASSLIRITHDIVKDNKMQNQLELAQRMPIAAVICMYRLTLAFPHNWDAKEYAGEEDVALKLFAETLQTVKIRWGIAGISFTSSLLIPLTVRQKCFCIDSRQNYEFWLQSMASPTDRDICCQSLRIYLHSDDSLPVIDQFIVQDVIVPI